MKDPGKGIFAPLIVRKPRLKVTSALTFVQVLSFATIIIGTINYGVPTGHVHAHFIYHLFWYEGPMHNFSFYVDLFLKVLCGLRDHGLPSYAHDMVQQAP